MVTRADLSLVASRVVRREIKSPALRKEARSMIQSLRLSRFDQGNFTIVTLSDLNGNVVGAGASKRMPTDFDDEAIGYNIALVRAVEVVVQDFADMIDDTSEMSKENGHRVPLRA